MRDAWPVVTLGDLFEIARGGSPRPIESFITDDPNGVNWVMISDAPEGSKFISSTKKRILPTGVRRSRMVYPGDFLLTNSMSFGRPYIMATSGCIHDGWLVLRSKSAEVDKDYFYYLLRSSDLYAEFSRRAAGATVKNLNIELVKGIQVPLPPLEEQRRIAEVLDRAETLRTGRRATLDLIDALPNAVFNDLFGGGRRTPIDIGDRSEAHPAGWRWELLTDVARLATGHTPDRKCPSYWDGNIPWITLTDIRRLDGSIAQDTEERITQAGIDNSAAVRLPAGTVCFSRTASVGFVTMMGRDMATSQDFVNWVCGPRVEPLYLMHALIRSRERLRALSTGSTHKTIYFPTVEQFRVLVPPLDLQREFGRRVEAVRRLKKTHRDSLVRFDELFASLQHGAFHGEL